MAIYSFKGRRYKTRGVHETVEVGVQMAMWQMVDDLVGRQPTTTDYLQIFSLSVAGDGSSGQKIVHSQEQPEYEATHVIPCEQPIFTKIYVIDDQTHITMLLAEEY